MSSQQENSIVQSGPVSEEAPMEQVNVDGAASTEAIVTGEVESADVVDPATTKPSMKRKVQPETDKAKGKRRVRGLDSNPTTVADNEPNDSRPKERKKTKPSKVSKEPSAEKTVINPAAVTEAESTAPKLPLAGALVPVDMFAEIKQAEAAARKRNKEALKQVAHVISLPKTRVAEVAEITRKYRTVEDYLADRSFETATELTPQFIARCIDTFIQSSKAAPSIGLVYAVIHLFADLNTATDYSDFAAIAKAGKEGDGKRLAIYKFFRDNYDYRYKPGEKFEGPLPETADSEYPKFSVFDAKSKDGQVSRDTTMRNRLSLLVGKEDGKRMMARLLCKLLEAKMGTMSAVKKAEYLGADLVESGKWSPNLPNASVWRKRLVLAGDLLNGYKLALTSLDDDRLEEVVTEDERDPEHDVEDEDELGEPDFEEQIQMLVVQQNLKEQAIKTTRHQLCQKKSDILSLEKKLGQLEQESARLDARLSILQEKAAVTVKFKRFFQQSARSKPMTVTRMISELSNFEKRVEKEPTADGNRVNVDIADVFSIMIDALGVDTQLLTFTVGDQIVSPPGSTHMDVMADPNAFKASDKGPKVTEKPFKHSQFEPNLSEESEEDLFKQLEELGDNYQQDADESGIDLLDLDDTTRDNEVGDGKNSPSSEDSLQFSE